MTCVQGKTETVTQTVLREFAGLHHVLAEQAGVRVNLFQVTAICAAAAVAASAASLHQHTIGTKHMEKLLLLSRVLRAAACRVAWHAGCGVPQQLVHHARCRRGERQCEGEHAGAVPHEGAQQVSVPCHLSCLFYLLARLTQSWNLDAHCVTLC